VVCRINDLSFFLDLVAEAELSRDMLHRKGGHAGGSAHVREFNLIACVERLGVERIPKQPGLLALDIGKQLVDPSIVARIVDRQGLVTIARRDVANVDEIGDSGDVVLVTVRDEHVPDREYFLSQSCGNALPRVEQTPRRLIVEPLAIQRQRKRDEIVGDQLSIPPLIITLDACSVTSFVLA